MTAPQEQERRVEASTVVALGLSILLATGGQLLLKAGMEATGAEVAMSVPALVELVRTVATSWRLVVGLVAFGGSALFWLVALSRLPLSTAYPVVSLSYVVVLGASTWLFDERPGLVGWAGALLVTAGVALIGIGQR